MQGVLVQNCAGIDIGCPAMRAVVARSIHDGLQGDAVPPCSEHFQRIEDGLHQQIVAACDERGDDIDNLSDVGDFNRIGMPDKAVQEAGRHQGVFQVIDFLDQVGCEFALPIGLVVLVPDVPFVETQISPLFTPAFGLHKAAYRIHLLDLFVD